MIEPSLSVVHYVVEVERTIKGRSGRAKNMVTTWNVYMPDVESVRAWYSKRFGLDKEHRLVSITKALN